MPTFNVVKLNYDGQIPTRAYEDDAGLDLCSSENVFLYQNEPTLVCTGIIIEIPKGHAGFVLPRSGLAIKHGITVLNSPGLIDPGYRGEAKVVLVNTGRPVWINKGDRIAQLVILEAKCFEPVLEEVITETKRSKDGFGSTGR